MKCKSCQKEEFELQDGKYVCKECETENLETRDETTEVAEYSRKTQISLSPKRTSNEKPTTYTAWTTTEAYNIIICKQVSALINLGASDKLKDVVLYMWSRYLQKCEVAFQPNKRSDVRRLSVYAKKRDLKIFYGDKYVKRKKKQTKSQSIKKKQTKVSKKKSKVPKFELSDTSMVDDDDAPPNSSVSEEFTMNNEDRMSDEENEIDSELYEKENNMDDELDDVEIDDGVNSSHAQNQKSTCGSTSKMNSVTNELDVYNMTISKTLCFCYLGILYTGDQLLLSDLIRFVHEGRIPYLNATSCFPSSMKLHSSDYASFNTNATPDLWKISMMCAKLIDFIDLPKFKHRSLIPIVFRFTKDLNLPDNVVHILKILLDKSKKPEDDWYETKKFSKSRYLPIPIYEVQAMSYIIIVLKMILVLDGKYELEHSEVMEKINILLEDRKLFVWNKWKKQASLIEYLFMKPGLTYSNFSLFDSLSADEIASKYPFISSTVAGEFSNKEVQLLTTARHNIKDIFWGLSSGKDKIPVKPEPTSFPLRQQIKYLMTKWDALPMYKETQQIDSVFLSEDMTSHQLFLKPASCDTSSDELISLLFSTLYESVEILTLSHTASNEQNILRSTSKYWYKNFSRSTLHASESTWLPALPSSFQWLLTLLCKYIHISHCQLYREVLKMEKELFLHVKNTRS